MLTAEMIYAGRRYEITVTRRDDRKVFATVKYEAERSSSGRLRFDSFPRTPTREIEEAASRAAGVRVRYGQVASEGSAVDEAGGTITEPWEFLVA